MALPILLDCDSGRDGTIAIVLALASSELDVKVITPSAGNRIPEKVLRNVLRMLALLNRTGIPVASGAVKLLACDLIIADSVYSESGLNGPTLPEPTFIPQDCTAMELMAKTLRKSRESATIISTGLQTNAALPFNSHPELYSKIACIVIMGGVMGLGNWTPAVEFSIYVDLKAAEIVFQSGILVVMAGLDITHKAQTHVEDTEHSRAIGNLISTIVARLLDSFSEYHKDEKWGSVGAPLHDPCTIAWLSKPKLFTTVERWIGAGTQGKYTQGITVVDYYYLADNKSSTTVTVDIDRQGFVDLLADRLKFYA